MKRSIKIILSAVIAAIAVVLTCGFIRVMKWGNAINEEVALRNEYHCKKFSEMEFKGKVVCKEIRTDKDANNYYLEIKSDSRFEQDLTLPVDLYRIDDKNNVILCRVTEEEYNTFQIGDSIEKTTGIEGAFQKISE